MKEKEIREAVRERYGSIAQREGSCCSPSSSGSSCCGPAQETSGVADSTSEAIGYSAEEMGSIPEGSNMGLGCGNPLAFTSLKEGDTVLDLGSGGGIDCFLAAKKVGEKGRVIGVDMTSPMIEKARENAERGGYSNVEFRLGELENLPVADSTVDLIISNCVINLSVNKKRVFEEAFRALKPGGTLMISDIVLLKALPEEIRKSMESYLACISGALQREEYLGVIRDAGFEEVRVEAEKDFDISDSEALGKTILSVSVSARKPD
ncbi:MAG TPA: arsenite methyltransferase [Spirochaetia bacterium]|nr:arsenite methyltransferase [Spirochaetia bacterium]